MKRVIEIILVVLSVVLPVLGLLAFLAGTDIYHGDESDLSNEWLIVSLFFYLSCLYILVNISGLIVGERSRPAK